MVSSPIVRGHRYSQCTRPARGGVTAVACWLLAPLALLGAPPSDPAAAVAPPPAEAAAPPPAEAAAPPLAEAAGASPSLSLPQAIDLALAANRALAAARLARPIAAANVAVAGERPNPDLLLEKLRETPHEAATLSLPIETAGKRGRRIDVATADAASGEAEIARTTAATRNQVRRAFYALLAAQRRAAEEEASLEIARRAAGAAKDRYEAGAAPRLDTLQAELTAAQASNDAEGARGLQAASRSQLNTLIDHPPQAPLAAAGDLTAGTVPETGAASPPRRRKWSWRGPSRCLTRSCRAPSPTTRRPTSCGAGAPASR
jgi:outer membrane protein TolC